MKKLQLNLLAIISLFLISFTVANAAGNYFSDQHPLANASSVKKALIAPTEIIVNNATYNTIMLSVPAGGFTDIIPPHGHDHVFNYTGSFDTYLVLKRADSSVFWYGTVCPHASITVFDTSVVVDQEACNH